MSKPLPTLRLDLPRRAGLIAALALGGIASIGVPALRAQSATIGYDPLSSTATTPVLFTGVSLSSNNAYIVPFEFNTLGNYSLASVSLLLNGTGDLANFSIIATSTLPTNFTLPTSLTTFAAAGALGSTPSAYLFNAGATPTLTANTPYYLRVAYTGPSTDTPNWVLTGGGTTTTGSGTTTTGSGTTLTFTYVTSTLVDGSTITYRTANITGSTTDNSGPIGGFSITANAVAAVPEPATYAGFAGLSVLLAAFIVRRRRRGRS